MICDKITELEKYAGFEERFYEIAEFLRRNDPINLSEGKHELSGGVYANVFIYDPSENTERDIYEVHKLYADLQYIVSGEEIIRWAPGDELSQIADYNEDLDYYLQEGVNNNYTTGSIILTSGAFVYFSIDEPHRPGLKLSDSKVKKIVFKIPKGTSGLD